jgi:metal-responsive CopG/Arc/MetJ family transcriptional regulator
MQKNVTPSRWKTVSLPAILIDKVEEHIKKNPIHNSCSDFISDAIRKELRL